MENQLTTEEVEKALKKLKYNESPGMDEQELSEVLK